MRDPQTEQKIESIVEDLGQSDGLAPLARMPRGTEPTAQFDYGAVHLNGGPSENEAVEQARQDKLEQLEAVIRTVAFVVDPARTPDQLWRRAHLIRHWLRPTCDQADLAKSLGVTPQAVSAGLDRLRAEIRHFFTN